MWMRTGHVSCSACILSLRDNRYIEHIMHYYNYNKRIVLIFNYNLIRENLKKSSARMNTNNDNNSLITALYKTVLELGDVFAS